MVTVHVVQGRQYSAYTMSHVGTSIAVIESETLESDKFQIMLQSQGQTRQRGTLDRSVVAHFAMRAIPSSCLVVMVYIPYMF
jgi:hypothetical protein